MSTCIHTTVPVCEPESHDQKCFADFQVTRTLGLRSRVMNAFLNICSYTLSLTLLNNYPASPEGVKVGVAFLGAPGCRGGLFIKIVESILRRPSESWKQNKKNLKLHPDLCNRLTLYDSYQAKNNYHSKFYLIHEQKEKVRHRINTWAKKIQSCICY